jgi:hypothetical protein
MGEVNMCISLVPVAPVPSMLIHLFTTLMEYSQRFVLDAEKENEDQVLPLAWSLWRLYLVAETEKSNYHTIKCKITVMRKKNPVLLHIQYLCVCMCI